MILDLGDCIDLSTKEKIFHSVVSIDRRKSKQFCYLSIKKKKISSFKSIAKVVVQWHSSSF